MTKRNPTNVASQNYLTHVDYQSERIFELIRNSNPIAKQLGISPGVTPVVKFFDNEQVGKDPEFLFRRSTNRYPYRSLAEGKRIAYRSTSSDDAMGGTGAWSLRHYGIRADTLRYDTEDLELDGTNEVVTEHEYVRVWRSRVLKTGSYFEDLSQIVSAVGDINAYIYGESEADSVSFIAQGEGVTQLSMHSTAGNTIFVIWDSKFNTSQDRDIEVKIYARTNFMDLENPDSPSVKASFELRNQSDSNSFRNGRLIPPLTDLFITGQNRSGGPNVTAAISGWYAMDVIDLDTFTFDGETNPLEALGYQP